MRLTLHDNILASGGEPHPQARPPISDAVRKPWVKAMHQLLLGAAPQDAGPGRAGRFAANLGSGAGKLRMRARRHGSAVSVVWSVGAGERLVAAGVLLAGRVRGDDAAAIAALKENLVSLPFADADYAGLAAEQRPCLGTLYLDARWYDNARVELAATALALAALYGPDGRLTLRQESSSPPGPADRSIDATGNPRLPSVPTAAVSRRPGPWLDDSPPPLKFNFTRPRLQVVMQMVTRKANAAFTSMPGTHFRVYPPLEFFDQPRVLRGEGIFDKLNGPTWCVRWHDGQEDRLSFGEFLAFVHQIIEIEQAFRTLSRRAAPTRPAPQNSSTWGPSRSSEPAAPVPIKVSRTLDARELTDDATIRRLLAAVTLETVSLPLQGTSLAATRV